MAGVPDLEEMQNIEAPTDEVEQRRIIDLFGIKVRGLQGPAEVIFDGMRRCDPFTPPELESDRACRFD